jgi:hypothetical protein
VGLFDFLRKGPKAPSDGAPVDRKLAALAKTAGDKHAQNYDRDEALRALCAVGTPRAVDALFRRFTFIIDPTITDQEEKALAFEGIVRVGKGLCRVRADGTSRKGDKGETLALEPAEVSELREAVIESARRFCKNAESLNWPLRVMRELLDDEAYLTEVLDLLLSYDTEYMRNVEPKVNLITAMEGIVSEDARRAVETYLDDVNETVRFHAVEATFKQGADEAVPSLVKMMATEESVRIKNKVAEGLARLGWTVPEELRETLSDALRDAAGWRVDRHGKVAKE